MQAQNFDSDLALRLETENPRVSKEELKKVYIGKTFGWHPLAFEEVKRT